MTTVVSPQPTQQISATETYSSNILGPVYFELSNLSIAGTSNAPAAPSQSPYIIASSEQFTVSLKVKFNDTPLTRLLLCLHSTIEVNFAVEGVGGSASEVDLTSSITTQKDVLEYEITYTGTPQSSDMTPGFYAIAAVAKVGPAEHPCSQEVLGYGYIAGVFLQVY